MIPVHVEVEDAQARPPRYIRWPSSKEPEAYVESVNCKLDELLAMAEAPR